MLVRRQLVTALLLLAVTAMPQVLGWGAHALEHHEHAGEAAGHGEEWAGLAQALVHGHEHTEGVPDHEHHLLPSPPWRQDAPRDLQPPAVASSKAPESGDLLLSSAHPWRDRIRLPGSSPPRLHLLCVLLI